MERMEMYLNALETGNRDALPMAVSKFDKRMEAIIDKYIKKIVNALRGAITETGEPYGTNGYKVGVMLGDGGKTEIANEHDMHLTGFIPVASGDIIRVKNITFKKDVYVGQDGDVYYYDSNFNYTAKQSWDNLFGRDDTYDLIRQCTVPTAYANTAYIRIFAYVIDDTTLITVNQEIE